METNAEKLQRALDSAKMIQGILDAELESGADTSKTRRDLDVALARVGSVQKKIEEERRRVEQAEAEARTTPSQEAKALASEANARLLADVHDVLAGLEQAPSLALPPSAAEAMLQAKARAAGKAAELHAARGRLLLPKPFAALHWIGVLGGATDFQECCFVRNCGP
jgi:seryl-tRNA synthetase